MIRKLLFTVIMAVGTIASYAAAPTIAELVTMAKDYEGKLTQVEKFSKDYEDCLNVLSYIYDQTEDADNLARIMGLIDEHNQHELSKPCDAVECHLERAQYFEVTGNNAQAREEYNAAFALPMTEEQKANACEQYAKFLALSVQDYEHASEYFSEAATAAKQLENGAERNGSLRLYSGLSYCWGEQYEKALPIFTVLVEDCKTYGLSASLTAQAYNALGMALHGSHEYRNARNSYQQEVSILEANGQGTTKDCAKAYTYLANIEKYLEEYDDSIAHYKKAAAIYNVLGLAEEQLECEEQINSCELRK
jgi:tetratricopeptide (TPR) repeat protein